MGRPAPGGHPRRLTAVVRLVLAAVGRMKAGPERELLDRYVTRARATARALGVSSVDLIEVDEGRGRSADERKREEAAALAARLPAGTVVIALDERGTSWTSPAFADRMGKIIDGGAPALAFAIGGPDGFDEGFRSRARDVVSFGAATLPHQLVRVVLAEQVYRAATILTGHPYHRA